MIPVGMLDAYQSAGRQPAPYEHASGVPHKNSACGKIRKPGSQAERGCEETETEKCRLGVAGKVKVHSL